MRRRVARAEFALLIAALAAAPALDGATYYVDASTGNDSRTAAQAQSESTPWRSIAPAANAARAGDTVMVAPGVYREQVAPYASGTASAPIVYRAKDRSNRPVIDGSVVLPANGWRNVSLTNFRGQSVQAKVCDIDWIPPAVFVGDRRLTLAHEPEQVNGDDPYELERMATISSENTTSSKTTLIDSAFFTQTQADYWKGADLVVFYGGSYGNGNVIEERTIASYNPSAHSVTVSPSFGYTFSAFCIASGDKWCLRNHIKILDAPGEYFVDTSVSPYQLYVIPPEGHDVSEVSATKFSMGFEATWRKFVTLDSFEIRNQATNGVNTLYGDTAGEGLLVTNCLIRHILNNGVNARGVRNVTIAGTRVELCTNEGISFGGGFNYSVVGCTVCSNANNGIWAGSGSANYYATSNVLVRGCYVFHQGGRRLHADNFQMQQCDNVEISNCRFEQLGFQNGWCQYTGRFVFTNNVVVGGPFGFGAVRNADISHNLFDGSTLRFDSHLDDAPISDKTYYLPVSVGISNNVVRGSASWWTWYWSSSYRSYASRFSVAANYYVPVAKPDDWSRIDSWDATRGVGYGANSVVADSPDADISAQAVATLFAPKGIAVGPDPELVPESAFGGGGPSGPVVIASGAEFLAAFPSGAMVEGDYRLAADIDLSGLGYASARFAGTLDGCGHTVGGLGEASLFDVLSGAAVSNLVVTGIVKESESAERPFGFVANVMSNSVLSAVTVRDCARVCTMNKKVKVGGLVGRVAGDASEIRGCRVTGCRIGGAFSAVDGGGVAALAAGPLLVSGCTVSTNAAGVGFVRGGRAGGFVAAVEPSGARVTIVGSTNECAVSGGYYAAGFVAELQQGSTASPACVTISNCANRGDVSATYASAKGAAAGVLGRAYRTCVPLEGGYSVDVTDCANYGNIALGATESQGCAAGGIVAHVESNTSGAPVPTRISRCVNYGDVSNGGIYAGGVAGHIDNTNGDQSFSDLANYGDVAASAYAGGIAGRANGGGRNIAFANVLSRGNVVATGAAGCAGGVFGAAGHSENAPKFTLSAAMVACGLRGTRAGGIAGAQFAKSGSGKKSALEIASSVVASSGSLTGTIAGSTVAGDGSVSVTVDSATRVARTASADWFGTDGAAQSAGLVLLGANGLTGGEALGILSGWRAQNPSRLAWTQRAACPEIAAFATAAVEPLAEVDYVYEGVTVPYEWLSSHVPGWAALGSDAARDAALAAQAPRHPNRSMFACYVLGLVPDDDSEVKDFRITAIIPAATVGHTPTILFEPNLGDKRVYTVEGSVSPSGPFRTPHSNCRFFRVVVSMP